MTEQAAEAWSLRHIDGCQAIDVISDDGITIATVWGHKKQCAPLMAAAPGLLKALKLCEGNIASLAAAHPAIYGEWLAVVSAAIAKATEAE